MIAVFGKTKNKTVRLLAASNESLNSERSLEQSHCQTLNSSIWIQEEIDLDRETNKQTSAVTQPMVKIFVI